MSNNILSDLHNHCKIFYFCTIKHKFMKTIKLSIFLILVCIFANAQEEQLPEKQSVILFNTTVYDFGNIPYNSEAKYEFIFKNISKESIALTNVRASCGCTSPEWSKEPIKKRNKGKVTITYDTRRVGNFSKSIYVYTNKSDQPVLLRVKGTVLSPTTEDTTAKQAQKSSKPVKVSKNSKELKNTNNKKKIN